VGHFAQVNVFCGGKAFGRRSMPYIAKLQVVGDDFEFFEIITCALNDNQAIAAAWWRAGNSFDLERDALVRLEMTLADGSRLEELLVRDRRTITQVRKVA
jgi:hypothetical protein